MKKVLLLAVVAVFVAGTAYAGFNVPTTGKDLAGQVAKGAASATVNKQLSGSKYQCTCAKGMVTGCDLKMIAGYLSAQRQGAERAGSKAGSYTDYEINIHSADNKCYEAAKKQLETFGAGSWDINRDSTNVGSGQVKFSVVIE